MSVNNFNIGQKVKVKKQIADHRSLDGHNSMEVNKNNVNQHDLLVGQVDQVAPLVQLAPEYPEDKTQQCQELHWWCRSSSSSSSSLHKLHCSVFCECVDVFLSASLFVGWPSHLFHSHICDLLGSDWYGNIIIQAWILSLSSLTPSLPTLHLSYLFHHIHISLPQLSLSSLHSIAPHTKTIRSLLPSFCILTLLSYHVFQRFISSYTGWSIWRRGAALSSILTYCENDEERAIVNQRVFAAKIDSVPSI